MTLMTRKENKKRARNEKRSSLQIKSENIVPEYRKIYEIISSKAEEYSTQHKIKDESPEKLKRFLIAKWGYEYYNKRNMANTKLNWYGEDVKKHISEFNEMIEKMSSKYTIAGYGASGRANMFCNLTNINKDVVKFIVDESPERCGRYIANTEIPIVSPSALKDSYVDLIIIFAWNYSKMIMDKTTLDFCRYLVAFPTVQVVSNYSQLKGFDSI